MSLNEFGWFAKQLKLVTAAEVVEEIQMLLKTMSFWSISAEYSARIAGSSKRSNIRKAYVPSTACSEANSQAVSFKLDARGED